MRKVLAFAVAAVLISNTSKAQFSEFAGDTAASQFTFSNGGNTLQIGGRVSGYYEYRVLKAGQTNLSHNGWAMKDGDVDLLGKTANHFTYEFHVSLLDVISAAATQNTADPAAPGFKAAYLRYDGYKVGIKFGFDKLPFALGSIEPEHMTPMWSHANLNGGDLFSRRDFGLTLNTSLMHNHINLYAGAYSGMGENFFEYGNDASGTFEYIGRAEYCLNGKMKYRVIDEEHTTTPQLRVALDARYADKTQPAGKTIGIDAPGKYGLRVINGKRLCYGGDVTFMYKGFSTNFEVDLMQLKPADTSDPLFNGTSSTVNKGVINAGGFVWDANYDFAKIRSVFTAKYEDVNVNDLVPGSMHWLSLGYAYKLNGFASVFKLEYAIPLQEDSNSDALKYTGQLRLGYQIVF